MALKTTPKKRTRLPVGHVKLSVPFPKITVDRIVAHCEEHNLHVNDFIRKAVYDKLPNIHEVDSKSIALSGPYRGETIGAIAAMDQNYIAWLRRRPVFRFVGDMAPIPDQEQPKPTYEHFARQIRAGEILEYGGQRSDSIRKVWAVSRTSWGQRKYRFLGVMST